MVSPKNLFMVEYWLRQPAIASGFVLWIFFGLFLLLIAGSIVLKIFSQYQDNKINKVITRRFSGFGAVMGLWGFVWLFLRQENVVFFGWRLWFLLWILTSLWWLANILRYIIKRVPEIKTEKIKIERLAKYLPAKK